MISQQWQRQRPARTTGCVLALLVAALVAPGVLTGRSFRASEGTGTDSQLGGSGAGVGVQCGAVSHVAITDNGFVPADLCVLVGQSVHFTNETSQSHSVRSDDGRFDSGNLQPGGGFSLAVANPRMHFYGSAGNPDFEGHLLVAMPGLEGPPDALAGESIPDLPFPPDLESEMAEHPLWLEVTSRTRLLVGFTPEATVAEANAALEASGIVVLGGIPEFGMLLMATPDSGDFEALDDG